jgi:hypothetical protein
MVQSTQTGLTLPETDQTDAVLKPVADAPQTRKPPTKPRTPGKTKAETNAVLESAADVRGARKPPAKPRAPRKTKAETEKEQKRIDSLAASVARLQDIYNQRIAALNGAAQRRTKMHKYLRVGSGVVALVSGGAVSAALVEFLPAYTKIVGALLAYASGIVTLMSDVFVDPKETHKMFEGAAHYAVIADRASALLDGRDMTTAKQLFDGLTKLRADGNKVNADYGPLLPAPDRQVNPG